MLRKLFGNSSDSFRTLQGKLSYLLSGETADHLAAKPVEVILSKFDDFLGLINPGKVNATLGDQTAAPAAAANAIPDVGNGTVGAPTAAPAAAADAIPTGGKWGPSAVFGTTGGTVTWSIAGADWTNQTNNPQFFTGSSVALDSFLPSDFVTQITDAFAAWSQVADINFVQVADGGGNAGVGTGAHIRIFGGHIDGAGDTTIKGRGMFPGQGTAGAIAAAGDIVFDSSDSWSSEILHRMAIHEIGHAIGLRDTPEDTVAIMNSFVQVDALQADDIAGIRAIYGPATAAAARPDLEVSSISAPLNVVQGQTLNFSYVVANAGNAAAGQHSAGIRIDGMPDDNNFIAFNDISALAAGGNTTLTNSINTAGLSVGQHTLFIKEDFRQNRVAESDENDNVRSVTFNVTAPVVSDLKISDAAVIEGNSGTRTMVFTVTRTGVASALDVTFSTVAGPGNAAAGSDYVAKSEVVHFNAGQSSKQVLVTINGDTVFEADETFTVRLSNATNGATISKATAVGRITNDDPMIDGANITGTNNSETLTGNALANIIKGLGGNDVLIGKGNADTLDGGADFDTADYSASAAAVQVNLTTGKGTGGDAQGDTLIGIERVVGSAFADKLTGSTLNDVLIGRGGGDTLDGAGGFDTADYSGSAAAVQVNLATGTGTGGDAQGDTLIRIEKVVGSALADHLTGSSRVETLSGGGGNDVIDGGGGVDTLDGGTGDDILFGDQSDIINGGTGFDQVYAPDNTVAPGWSFTLTANMNVEGLSGNHGNNVLDASAMTTDVYLVGFDGDDKVIGGSGDDYLVGDAYSFSPAGDDIMHGGAGSDNMYGYNGNDIMFGDGSDLTAGIGDRLFGGAGIDTLHGGGGGYVLGEEGNDTLTGGNLDLVSGGADNDTVLAAAGTQQIDGGDGDDTLSGGADPDTFIFSLNFGRDTVTDFTSAGADHDIIQVSTALFADWNAIVAADALTDVAGNATLHTSDGLNVVTFEGVTSAQLIANHVNDFIFV